MAISRSSQYKRKDKVVSTVDLPGVPAGTEGKVLYEAGVTWMRYRVAFTNGRELGQVDGNALRLKGAPEAGTDLVEVAP